MDYVLNSDTYEIKLASLVSNIDKDVMVELYQPLVGGNATILYLTLLKQKRNEIDDPIYKTSALLNTMQLTPAQFYSARRMLEGVGLLRSYMTPLRQFVYVLYAPKNPKDFFDDVLFKGLLIQYIGEKETKRIAQSYKINLELAPDYQEVSASFVDVFHPNYDDVAFKKDFKENYVGHDQGRVRIDFNDDLFFKYLSEVSGVKEADLGKRDLKEIARYATLFGLKEKQMAFIVADVYNPDVTPHINFQAVATKAEQEIKFNIHPVPSLVEPSMNSSEMLAKKCQMMETSSPAKFLSILQNNTKPSVLDLKIVDELSKNFGFSNGVINALVDYCLQKNDNILSKNYVEKVASSLARSNIKTAIDAMNYLNRINNHKSVKPVEEEHVSKQSSKPSKKIEKIDDDELNDILNDLEARKGGKR